MSDTFKNAQQLPGRSIGTVNWLGLYTLYLKECRRFMKVWAQTLAAPAVTTVLFMVIFSLALGGQGRMVADMPYAQFLAPGLIVMAILQNAFANTSSSILIAKVQGNIVDTLMPPLSALELTAGFAVGGITRGILVGLSVGIAFILMPGVDMSIAHLWAVIYYGLAASMMLSLAGILTGVWAEKFDHSAFVTNFIIAPLSLLSGTFYSISRLSESWQFFSHLNPFFYLIDGFRYGLIGRADSDLMVGVTFTLVLNIILMFAVYFVFKKGYRLKA
ncbi:transport permease protein [Kordiimonas sediminis]|uniref:Transport permease protein n=1 Tax=Kordiimonas sediminis TaxID=1735581 RepID=A0A919AJW4_9PROT|nr:ABC transporter permease [Kordiimonas sediminis]GHF12913.1 transport permease protein [Kordiimonas sediminis]